MDILTLALAKKYTDEVTGGGISPSGGQAYSTEETVVGTWIDGRPLYRITVYTTSPSATNVDEVIYDASHLDIDLWVNLYGFVIYGVALNQYYYDSNFISTYRGANNTVRMCVSMDSYTNGVVYFTLEYTKTTDVAPINLPDAASMLEAYDEGVQSA